MRRDIELNLEYKELAFRLTWTRGEWVLWWPDFPIARFERLDMRLITQTLEEVALNSATLEEYEWSVPLIRRG